jgi:hypothetical protein
MGFATAIIAFGIAATATLIFDKKGSHFDGTAGMGAATVKDCSKLDPERGICPDNGVPTVGKVEPVESVDTVGTARKAQFK